MKIYIDAAYYEFPPMSVRGAEFFDTPGATALQLISLGAVREDGAEFYAENADFTWEDIPADHKLSVFVRPNLIAEQTEMPAWMSITKDLMATPFCPMGGYHRAEEIAIQFRNFAAATRLVDGGVVWEKPEFWGYFSEYTWVLLRGLYPHGYPREFPRFIHELVPTRELPAPTWPEGYHALKSARWIRDAHKLMAKESTDDR